MKTIIFILIALFFVSTTTAALANPFLISDPQCKNAGDQTTNCADGFELSKDNGATWTPAGSADVGADQIRLYHDLNGLAEGVVNNWQVRSVNVWGASSAVPFEFTPGKPSEPTGLGVEP